MQDWSVEFFKLLSSVRLLTRVPGRVSLESEIYRLKSDKSKINKVFFFTIQNYEVPKFKLLIY